MGLFLLLLTTGSENDGPLGSSHKCLNGRKKAGVIVKNDIHLFEQDQRSGQLLALLFTDALFRHRSYWGVCSRDFVSTAKHIRFCRVLAGSCMRGKTQRITKVLSSFYNEQIQKKKSLFTCFFIILSVWCFPVGGSTHFEEVSQ